MNQVQTNTINGLKAARANVTFTIAENGPMKANCSNVREPKLQTGTVYVDAPSFPTITIGPKGGVVVWVRSYPEGNGKTAFDAAVVADVLLAKQTARDNGKKTVAIAVPDPFANVPADVNSTKPTNAKK